MTATSQHWFDREPVDSVASNDDTSVSLIYALLPPMVRRSVPKVRSLRKSFTNYSSFGGHARASSIDSTEGTRTPPPAYNEVLAPLTAVLSDDEEPSIEASSSASMEARFAENEHSGIQWKYATQGKRHLKLFMAIFANSKAGLSLLTLSAQESACLTSNASFSRQLYVDAATYLLRGLPDELTEEELISLRAATPTTLLQNSAPVGQLILREDGAQEVERTPQDYEPTVLHRIVSMAVFQFFIILAFLWPYIQVFVRKAYTYERNHHISERFASQTWLTANAIGKRTVSTANSVCTWNDGQVGESLESVISWWIQGVAGGLCEGMGEGMEAFGVKLNRASPRRREAARGQRP